MSFLLVVHFIYASMIQIVGKDSYLILVLHGTESFLQYKSEITVVTATECFSVVTVF